MDFEQKKEEYLKLRPPVSKKPDGFTVYFSEEELKIINESVPLIDEETARKERMTILLNIRKEMSDNEEVFLWTNSMVWNESCGFVKNMILRYGEPAKEHFGDLMGECCKAVIENIDRMDPEKGTLTTFLTTRLYHAISEYLTTEINKNTSYKSKNMRAVEKAKQYFKENGKTHITKTDIAMHTGLSIPKVEDALINIEAKNAISLDDDLAINTISNSISPEDLTVLNERSEVIGAAIDTLEPDEREIIRLMYDLDDRHGRQMSIAGVAKIVGSTADKVEKILRKSLRKLRNNKELREFYAPPVEVRKAPKITNTQKIDMFFDEFINECVPTGCQDYNPDKPTNKKNAEESTINW